MKPPVIAAAALCLLAVAAQPASAAWTTSRQGNAPAKAGQLVPIGPVTCTGTTVRWTAAGGPVTYSVYFANGSQYPNTPDVTTTSTTATAPGKVNILVKAFVGSWSVQAESAGKICS